MKKTILLSCMLLSFSCGKNAEDNNSISESEKASPEKSDNSNPPKDLPKTTEEDKTTSARFLGGWKFDITEDKGVKNLKLKESLPIQDFTYLSGFNLFDCGLKKISFNRRDIYIQAVNENGDLIGHPEQIDQDFSNIVRGKSPYDGVNFDGKDLVKIVERISQNGYKNFVMRITLINEDLNQSTVQAHFLIQINT